MDKIRRFLKSKLGFAIILSLFFCLMQIPLILNHEITLAESQFYYRYFAPLGISYLVARFLPLAFTTLTVFLLSCFLPIRKLYKVCIAFSSIFFYFNSVFLVGFQIIPMGRELSFANPAEFFTVINEAFYHTFLPVVQLCLIPIILYVLDLIFHFKFLRKLEIVKWAGQHHISGAVVFIIPIALSIPNAIISGVEDFYHRYSNDSAITEVAEELNQLPAGSAIAFSNQAMRYFAAIYEPLLTNDKYFYDMTTGARLSVGMGLDGKETVAASELVAAMPDEGHVYFLLNTDSCTPTFKSEPQSNWEYLGLIRQLDDKKAFDFYKVK